ncbi:ankyrin repeat-containing protein [Heterostelium album PN500]|uniref:Ankyrin repeat-containing protein n=1 Tax=Heterostelium pallidum (strain ATCC 26659 / Pp 5 / PN500) TaxID=670386 RepID=D3B2F3_HETP5|nr:ankyrin repeat-containing protein [Heterostelium album PN500]EFA84528.1 ankyrin repeat-containing protein [Heterostelium album PN500]|eukprot:XP_020436641.1 ankyrin repeat-containing protein [Heterostelium album PN500]
MSSDISLNSSSNHVGNSNSNNGEHGGIGSPFSLSSSYSALSTKFDVRKSDSSWPTSAGASTGLNSSSNALLLNSSMNGRSMMSMSSSSIDSGNFDNEDEIDNIKNSNKLRAVHYNYSSSGSLSHYSSQQSYTSNCFNYCAVIDDLALEVIIHIFRFLSPFDLRQCASVCKFWSILCSSDALWEEKCVSQWAWMRCVYEEKLKFGENKSWKDFYRYWATEYLKYTGWYHYSLTREEATAKLQNMAKGTFLIRKSSKPSNLVISYNVHSKKPQHLLLYDLGPHVGVFLNDEMGKIYPTISALVKEKKKFLKRPYSNCNRYEKKVQSKREYINLMIDSVKDRQGKSIDDLHLLHLASKWCFKDLIELLVSKGINVNKPHPKNGKTPLHYSLCFIHGEPNSDIRLQIVALLLSDKCGSQVNLIDHKGRSPLHIAVKQHQSDSVKMVDLILSHGADVMLSQNDGLHPLHIATKENNLAMVRLLLKHKNINVNCKINVTPQSKLEDNHGDTPLHIASHSCMYPIVKELLEFNGIDVNILDNKKRCALHRCVLRNQDWLGMTRFAPAQQLQQQQQQQFDTQQLNNESNNIHS